MLTTLLTCSILLNLARARDDWGLPQPPYPIEDDEISPQYWENLARVEIDKANRQFLEWSETAKPAKNVILFLGDGMGIPTLAATRFDQTFTTGEAAFHPFEEWNFGTLCRTYDLETMVTDSASSATAYLTGTKTRTSMIGVTGAVKVHQCSKYTEDEMTESALKAAQKTGRWTGIVTSSRITHASPSGCYGHVAFRDWESDSELECPTTPCQCSDLAYQLIEENPDINVIMGGGQQNFYPENVKLPSDTAKTGNRKDGKKLTDQWESYQKSKARKYLYVDSPKSFNKVENFADYDYVLSLTAPSHLNYELDKKPEEPGLFNLTMAAIKVLKKSPNGFFLFVEGARIDQAHHENRAKKSFAEMHAFDETIRAVTAEIDPAETLLIVTADHSHSFGLNGQQSRQRSLFEQDWIKGNLTLDHKGMLAIGYMTGPGAKTYGPRDNVTSMNSTYLNAKETQLQALIPIDWATHGGDDVAVYANGPFSYLFHKTVDNTYVAQSMKYAMCAPPYNKEPFCAACVLQISLLTMLGLIIFVIFS